MQQNYPCKKGFTVIELVVVLPIAVACMAFLGYIFYFQYWVFNAQSAELAITYDARQSLDSINQYIRQSYRVASSYSTYTTGAQTLVLQLQSINASSQPISGSYDYVVVYLSGTNLYLQVFPNASSTRTASTKKIASDINTSSFGFTYNNATYSAVTKVTTTMAITATVKNQISSQTRSITVSSEAKLRNY